MIAQPRRLCEIVGVDRGVSLELRATKTGETFVVNERLGSMEAEVGEFLITRIAAVGDAFQSFGAVIDVPLRLRASALALADADPPPTADEYAAWYGAAHRPPAITNTEGEDILVCEIRFATTESIEALHTSLDALFDCDDDGEWSDVLVKANGERLVRGLVRYDDGELIVVANSAVRANRIVDALHGAVPGLVQVSDQRLTLEEAKDHVGTSGDATPREVPPDAAAFHIADVYRRSPQADAESDWSDEATVAKIAEEPW